VSSGVHTTAAWSGLTPGNDYEWYVTLNDGKVTTTGPTWTFKASAGGNTAPVAANDAYPVNEDVTLNVAAPGVLTNDTDADGNSLSATIVSAQPWRDDAERERQLPYAGANYNGPDSFTYGQRRHRGLERGDGRSRSVGERRAGGERSR
jgi:hypothetical protein